MKRVADSQSGGEGSSGGPAQITGESVGVVVLAILITFLDGFDVQAMAFAAPAVSHAWHIDRAVLGLVLGSSLFGMAGGSLGLAPLADVFGRRPLVLGGLAIMTAGSLASALSHTVPQLLASRAVTGLGIGVMIPLTTAIAAEFSSERRRTLAIAGTTVGHSVGGAAGGLIAALFLKHSGWQGVFAFGSAAGAALFVATTISLPESPHLLAARAARMAGSDLSGRSAPRGTSYRALFVPGLAGVTLRLAAIYILLVTAAYYLLSWLPQLVADTGYPPSTASLVTGVTSLVGIASGLIAGTLGARVGPARLASAAMLGFGLALAGVGLAPPTLPALIVAASACALFLSAATAVFYATLASSFPDESRVSGIGFVMGFGRLLSGFGPYVAGVMFAAGLTRGGVSLIFAGAALLAGGLLYFGGTGVPSGPAVGRRDSLGKGLEL